MSPEDKEPPVKFGVGPEEENTGSDCGSYHADGEESEGDAMSPSTSGTQHVDTNHAKRKRVDQSPGSSPEHVAERATGPTGGASKAHENQATFIELVKLGWTPPQVATTKTATPKPKAKAAAALSIPGTSAALSTAPTSEAGDDPWRDNFSLHDPKETFQDNWAGIYEEVEATGPDLPDRAAHLLNAALFKPIPESRDKETTEAYPRPANATSMHVPRCNPEVWKGLKKPTKENDSRLQKAQTLLLRGITPVIQLLSEMQEKMDAPNRNRALDAVHMLAGASHALSIARRQAYATDMFPQFRPLCAPNRPFGRFLFGDEEDLRRDARRLTDKAAGEQRMGYGDAPPKGRGTYNKGRGQQRAQDPQQQQGGKGRGQKSTFFAGRGQQQKRRRGPPKRGGKQSSDSAETPKQQ